MSCPHCLSASTDLPRSLPGRSASTRTCLSPPWLDPGLQL